MKALPAAGSERRRQLTWLIVLLVLLATVLVWTRRGPAVPGAATSNPADKAPVPAAVLARPEPVELAALDAVPDPPEPTRNPFGFGVKPPPPPQPAPPRVETPVAPLPPPVPQGPPPIALRLVMIVTPPDGRRIVTLRDPATNATFLAAEGDVVDGRYRVSKVTATSAVVSYVDGAGTRTLWVGR